VRNVTPRKRNGRGKGSGHIYAARITSGVSEKATRLHHRQWEGRSICTKREGSDSSRTRELPQAGGALNRGAEKDPETCPEPANTPSGAVREIARLRFGTLGLSVPGIQAYGDLRWVPDRRRLVAPGRMPLGAPMGASAVGAQGLPAPRRLRPTGALAIQRRHSLMVDSSSPLGAGPDRFLGGRGESVGRIEQAQGLWHP
jgi:hypothetical protein